MKKPCPHPARVGNILIVGGLIMLAPSLYAIAGLPNGTTNQGLLPLVFVLFAIGFILLIEGVHLHKIRTFESANSTPDPDKAPDDNPPSPTTTDKTSK